jgi:UDP-2-acetamido-2,6-beta-L-arabino-hexul-4-ose reductase
MKVLITGASGFIAKNLNLHLQERNDVEVFSVIKGDSRESIREKVHTADFIFHLAGVNRPQHEDEFKEGNVELTRMLCEAVKSCGREIPIVYTSSIQVERENAYGISKREAENILNELSVSCGTPVYIYRLPNVFGKWCKPNYNSVVATFCYNIVNDLPIQINNADAEVSLVYIDDVISNFLCVMDTRPVAGGFLDVEPIYTLSVGGLAEKLYAFHESRSSLLTEQVGAGFIRALYSTYISYFQPEQFYYPLRSYKDARGVFVEMLKTTDSGQFSYFTAHPGVTRGGHYHHSKTEKFLVIKGRARFRFRHVATGEKFEHGTDGDIPEVVETIPGWSHDITNIGDEEMVVMLWANEVFDRQRPDTVAYEVE